ncbi:hypothetical protein Tco_0744377 [Tanacetum coccineum]
METCDPVGTPIEIKDKLDLDKNGTLVDATKYRSMIGALMYLTSSRPDIVHATCLYARYQAKPTEKHLKEVKRIFCYLRGTVNMGLWYTKDSGFELTGFSDANYAGCKDTFKSTFGGTQLLGSCKEGSRSVGPIRRIQVCGYGVLKFRGDTAYLFHGYGSFGEEEEQPLKNTLLSSEVDFHDRLPKLRPLIDAYVGTVKVPSRECDNDLDPRLKEFWKIVRKVPDTEDTIILKLDSQEIIYTVDMVGYQGVVDKVSAFFTKNLAQPWQTMFKDFMNNVFQKKDVIQYPRFTKLIIADLMKKYPSISLRLEEDYHSIKDDILLENHATNDYKEYETVFVNVFVLINQPQLVVSTQGMHKSTPRAHKTPTLTAASPQGKKRKQSAGETSSPQKSLKELTVTVSPSTTTSSKDPHKKRHISKKYSQLPGAFRKMCRRQGYMIRDMERKCVTTDEFWKVHIKVDQTNVIQVHPTTTTSTETTTSADRQQQLYLKMKSNLQDQANDPALWDVLKQDDAPSEGEKRVKRHTTSKRSKSERGFLSKQSTKDSTTYVSKQQQKWDA